MLIKFEKPPHNLYQRIREAGMPFNEEATIFTYGDTVYNPKRLPIPEHLQMHEQTHSKQQGSNPMNWWERYLFDPYFRIEQEAEAYGQQYRFICRNAKDRNVRNRILMDLAVMLASPMYGSVVTTTPAMKMIKDASKSGPKGVKLL